MEETVQAPRGELPRREAMQRPEEVAAMAAAEGVGWGVRRENSTGHCSQRDRRQPVRHQDNRGI
jgi:hypothetical protein